jgi:glycosyltransferase involved in cell wall biosynthesis
MKDLSILIPARNEMFLARTIEDILEHIEADTEIIAVLDGALADPGIVQHERVNVIYVPEALGQRATTNMAARLAQGKYVAKVDAHCSFDQGFDRKMIEFFQEVGDDVVAVPVMRNLWAFSWKCYHCGWKKYQGPTPEKCEQCGETDKIRRKMIWEAKRNPQSVSYCFDSGRKYTDDNGKEQEDLPHFQYFEDYKHREPFLTDKKTKSYTETMSLQGSFFMSTREKFWEWELSDERLGNWGNQGIELACACWLSGGRVLVNHKTWYAHMFRTQGGDFGFPWENGGRATHRTKRNVRDKFWQFKHPTQIHPVSWLIEKFWPVNGWSEEDLAKLKDEELR